MTRNHRAGIAARALAVTAAAGLVLTACAGDPAEEAPALELSDEPVTLSFTWWGNDVRHEATQTLIDMFEEEYPNITIEPQYTDWAGYWDKLATSVAAGDAPDIIQMDEKQLSTYGGNGVLMDLDTLSSILSTEDFPESVLATGNAGGTQYGVPIGINSYTFLVNLDILEQYGIEAPDQDNWTWEDLAELGKEVSEASGGSVYGVQSWGFEDGGLNNWARQHGDALYNADGEIVIKPETLEGWWQFLLDITKDGVTPPPAATVEKASGGVAESFTATNTAAFGNWWSNQVSALQDASGQNVVIYKLPVADGAADDTFYYKPSMFWSASADTEHPAEVATFIDWLSNSEAAADVLLTERGVPANEKIREYITPKLDEVSQTVVEFLDEIAPNVGDAPAPTPPGGGAIEALIKQYTEAVLFETMTPADAAEGFIADLQTALDDAA